MRRAIVQTDSVWTNGDPVETVNRHLPSNYVAVENTDGTILITGEDSRGWTMEDYVIPRLRSGLIAVREVPTIWE